MSRINIKSFKSRLFIWLLFCLTGSTLHGFYTANRIDSLGSFNLSMGDYFSWVLIYFILSMISSSPYLIISFFLKKSLVFHCLIFTSLILIGFIIIMESYLPDLLVTIPIYFSSSLAIYSTVKHIVS